MNYLCMEDCHSQPGECPQSQDVQLRDTHQDAPHLLLELAQEAVEASGECDRFDDDAPANHAFSNEAFIKVPAKARKGRSAAKTKHPINSQINSQTTELPAQLLYVSPAQLRARPGQPRQLFEPKTLTELARSFQTCGVLQPLIARPLPADSTEMPIYEIVSGERRWRASQEAGLAQVPVSIRNLDDDAAAKIGLVENLQRQDLTPLETAAALAQMIKQGYSVRKLAEAIGKEKGWVEEHLLLARLPDDLKSMVSGRPDTLTHARELKKVADPLLRADLIAQVTDEENPLPLAELRRCIRQSEKDKASQKAEAPPTTGTVETADANTSPQELSADFKHEGQAEENPPLEEKPQEVACVEEVTCVEGDHIAGTSDAEETECPNAEYLNPGFIVESAEATLRQEALKDSLHTLTRTLDEFERPTNPAVLEEMTRLIQRLQLALGMTLHHWSLNGKTKSVQSESVLA